MADAARKPVIGIVGGVGSGKSFVARLLASLGCAVIDADELVRQAYREPQVIDAIRRWWGDDVVRADGEVDRKRIASIVFDNPAELAKLEGLLHPRVNAERARLREQYQADPDVVAIVEDTPLLLEKGLDKDCDVLVFIESSLADRQRRVAAHRGWSAEQLAGREKKQTPLDIKAQRADYVVQNHGDEATCLAHVRRVLSRILHEFTPAT